MSKRTKKAGSSGRYGARYGVIVRNRVKIIEAQQKRRHECPVCHHMSVKRVSSGIWECKRCDTKLRRSVHSQGQERNLQGIGAVSMYRCAKCNEPIRTSTMGLQCEKWVEDFLQRRPNIKKVLKSD